MPNTLEKNYSPKDIEKKWQHTWEEKKSFHAKNKCKKKSYSIVIPPPNITGILHLGHILNNTIQDVLARRARQKNKNTLWLAGYDHAGIATQNVVEKNLIHKEKKNRHDLGREKFIEKVWDWKEQNSDTIIKQLQSIGCSLDWSRQRFTLDKKYSKSVQKCFTHFFKKGNIYRGKRMVNWCPKSLTALSDEEVIMKANNAKLYFVKYEIENTKEKITIATSRPETIMGDSAIAVNPNDKRYQNLIGKHAYRPLPQSQNIEKRKIKIIADENIDIEFGTGALKVTPAHDKLDFEIGQKHSLETIDILNENGTLNENAGPEYKGLERFEARKKIAQDLEKLNILEKIEEYENNIGYSERANVPIEPRISMQWFLKYPKVTQSSKVVESKKIHFRPARWEKTYLHWMENIQDWCISRQLWWGHRIPIWYKKNKYNELMQAPELNFKKHKKLIRIKKPKKNPEKWIQDPDVLDTWFSSWLWPFATMKKNDKKIFFPTNDLVTGADIIFFWVARMIMASLEFEKKIPFKNVYFNSLVRDIKGRKMSKSLNNSPDTFAIIDKFGADGLRFGLLRIAPIGQDVRFDEKQIEEGRNFCTKIWNASRLRILYKEKSNNGTAVPLSCRFILLKLSLLEQKINKAYKNYRFNELANSLYEFFWNDFCDKFLEAIKAEFINDQRTAAVQSTIDTVLKKFLWLAHPIIPHISEELWEKLSYNQKILTETTHKDLKHTKINDLNAQETLADANSFFSNLSEIRSIFANYNLTQTKNLTLYLKLNANIKTTWHKNELHVFTNLLKVKKIELIDNEKNLTAQEIPCGTIYLDLSQTIDVEKEKNRHNKAIIKIDKEINNLKNRLQNKTFIEKAPKEVISKNKQELEILNEKKEKIENILNTL